MNATFPAQRPPVDSFPLPMRGHVDFLPLRSDFDEVFQFLLLSKLLLARTAVSPSGLLRALFEHHLTGLTLEHLSVKHQLISFSDALQLLGERRLLMERITGQPSSAI